jgi:4-amino-4-deoxy-L-arabinose transferase-like glycosyltransferase
VYVYLTARGLMLAVTGVAFGLLYLALRRLGSSLALLAIGLLCLQPRLIQDTIQIRPDVPAICTWLAVLLALIRWRETGEPRWIWSTGLLLGLTAAFSP